MSHKITFATFSVILPNATDCEWAAAFFYQDRHPSRRQPPSSSLALVGPLAGRQPAGAVLAQLASGHFLVPTAVGLAEGVAPATVGTLVDEGPGAAFPEGAAER